MADFSAPETLVLAGLVAFAAGVVRGITGFGGAMVMAPPLALLLGPRTMVPVTLLLESIAALPMLWQTRREVRWRTIGPILAACSVTAPLGGYVLLAADPLVLRRAIAAIVIVFALVLLRGWRYAGAQRLGTSVGLGSVSGVMVGSTSIGAPPVILYLLSGPDPISTTRANLTFYLAGSCLAALAVLALQGVLDSRSAVLALVFAPGYWCGLAIGTRLFPRFNDLRFRRFTLLLLVTVSTGILLA
jgi:uncharacterized membrane protein YfcA